MTREDDLYVKIAVKIEVQILMLSDFQSFCDDSAVYLFINTLELNYFKYIILEGEEFDVL